MTKVTVAVTRTAFYDIEVDEETLEALESGDLSCLSNLEPDSEQTIDHSVNPKRRQ